MTDLDQLLGEGKTAGLAAAYTIDGFTIHNVRNAASPDGSLVSMEWQWWVDAEETELACTLRYVVTAEFIQADALTAEPKFRGNGVFLAPAMAAQSVLGLPLRIGPAQGAWKAKLEEYGMDDAGHGLMARGSDG
jgi:hypothetical protein